MIMIRMTKRVAFNWTDVEKDKESIRYCGQNRYVCSLFQKAKLFEGRDIVEMYQIGMEGNTERRISSLSRNE